MQRTGAIIAASVVAALAVGGVLAAGGGAQTPGGITIKLVTKNCSYNVIDVPPRMRKRNGQPSGGDGNAGVCQVFKAAGGRAGRLDYSCVSTQVGKRIGASLCQTAYTLAGDELHAVARPHDDDRAAGVIVGGTGAYAGARGTFTSKDRAGANERNGYPKDDVITLLP